MGIVLPKDPEDKKRAMLDMVRGKATSYTVGKVNYVVVPRQAVDRTPAQKDKK